MHGTITGRSSKQRRSEAISWQSCRLPGRETDRTTIRGVTYFASEFEARMVEASMLPSDRGNGSLLADVIEDAGGNVIGPAASVNGFTGRLALRIPAAASPRVCTGARSSG